MALVSLTIYVAFLRKLQHLLCCLGQPQPTPPCSQLTIMVWSLENKPLPPPPPPRKASSAAAAACTTAAAASLLTANLSLSHCVAGSLLPGASLVRALRQFHVGTDGPGGQMCRCGSNLSSCTNTVLHKRLNQRTHTYYAGRTQSEQHYIWVTMHLELDY